MRRPALSKKLAGAESVPLVLVSAPAGTGKTSLVAEWVRSGGLAQGRTGWVTFDDGDQTFWPHLVACLARTGLDVAYLADGVVGDAPLGRARLSALSAAIADANERLTVVLDGYELVSLALAREVDFLLGHTFGRLRLVFVGRVDPVLPLYRYRLRESLVEVRAQDLAFDDDAAATLFEHLAVSLSRQSVHDLNARVRGWVAGLRFAGRALAGQDDPERGVATVLSQTGDINEYLLGEVLDTQPPEVRSFLLDTSVPEILCSDLVGELGGPRAVRTLATLAGTGAFMEPVPEEGGYFRYYPFFRDLLRAQLAYESPERVVEVHRRTAAWLGRQGLLDQAVEHLAAAEAWDEVAGEIVGSMRVGRILIEGRDTPLAGVGRRLPPGTGGDAGAVVRAAAALAVGDPEACDRELSEAPHAVDATGTGYGHAPLWSAVLHAVRAALGEPAVQAAALAERAADVARARPAALSAGDVDLRALVEVSRGVALLRRGRLQAARKALKSAAETRTTSSSFRGEVLGYLAMVDVLEGRCASAARTAAEAVLARGPGVLVTDRPPAAHVALARVALERYDLASAKAHLESASSGGLGGDPVSRAVAAGVAAAVQRAGGHPHSALKTLASAVTELECNDPWLADVLRLDAARLQVATGSPERALLDVAEIRTCVGAEVGVVSAAAYSELGRDAAAAELLAPALSEEVTPSTALPALLVEAVLESRRGAQGRARLLLGRALRLASGEGLYRPVREAGPSVQRLLAANPDLRTQPERSGRRSSARVGTAIPAQRAVDVPSDSAPEIVEELTAKEREVLCYLQELLTTEEIAQKMFVSVNTVRTHVRSILRKLGVNRRNAAVRKARELGLVGG